VLDSTDMLKNFLPIFAANLIDGLSANEKRLKQNIEKSPVIVTLLAPKIGYQKSSDLFKESLKTGKTIRELVTAKKLMSQKELDTLFK
jgi:aspartate ammonia-lyase